MDNVKQMVNSEQEIVLVLHSIRSSHNVGSLLRSADGFGIKTVYFSGITPYPAIKNDPRLPHLRTKITKQINKTALGAEKNIDIKVCENINDLVANLRNENYAITALEQASGSIYLNEFSPPAKLALILGNEVEGLDSEVMQLCDLCLEIPMQGKKESFNVSVAGAIALYEITTPRN